METLKFTLERQEQPVEIDGEEYVLLELDGKERDQYLNKLAKRLKSSSDGKSQSVKEFDGLQAALITMSLRKCTPEGRVAVDIKTIQTWPARMVKTIFDAARELSGLTDDEDEGDEKND